jgi:hypothetical protein
MAGLAKKKQEKASYFQVAIINASTVLKDNEVKAALPALQTQVHRDFAPVWGIDADLTFVPKGSTPPQNYWWIAILDNSDVAGALGYHDVTDQGLPIGKVFAGTDKEDGLEWTVTASHELLEQLADPEVYLTVFAQPKANEGILYMYEVCDACEADEFGYKINGTMVSDFVYPSWFETFREQGSTQFDYGNHLQSPVPELLPGGYIGAFDVVSGTGWHQITKETDPHTRGVRRSRPRVGSRRERRRLPRDQWLKSVVRR